MTIRVAIAGVGNCASALVQGTHFYRDDNPHNSGVGLANPTLGGYRCADIEFAAAFDVDARKVGKPLTEAIFASPNCAARFATNIPDDGVIVQMGPELDGIAEHMRGAVDGDAFCVSDEPPVALEEALAASGADVLVCYMPVGSTRAAERYAEACINAGVAMVNCMPVPIASCHDWAARFRDARLPIVGDDIKSQVGATIVHRVLAALMEDRGVKLERTYQLNTGGNTDFLNMLDRSRLEHKRRSKTGAVQAQLATPLADRDVHIGPSDFVPWLDDRKLAFIRLEGSGFGEQAVEMEIRLSVEDSPNSAGVAIDAIRCAKVGLDRGWIGPIEPACALYMKSPPVQHREDEATRDLKQLLDG
ncbi:MAG: inositol-3-phosphate synthase [Pseudomonadota bacterium]